MTARQQWLSTMWTFVRENLPPTPARVLEIGCGTAGGFVPALLSDGYDAIGVDPEAPEGEPYHHVEFERFTVTPPVDAIVAATSLHHVADLDEVLDHVASGLVPGGTLIVVEWARENLDEATALWSFDRLAPAEEPEWLHRRRDEWRASGRSWDAYFAGWAAEEHLHTGRDIVDTLRARFETVQITEGAYLFSGLDGVTEADERAAIDAGEINASGLRYVGRASHLDK